MLIVIDLKNIDQFRGWKIYCNPSAPITGRYQAIRYGVSMCAGNKEALINMIKNRNN